MARKKRIPRSEREQVVVDYLMDRLTALNSEIESIERDLEYVVDDLIELMDDLKEKVEGYEFNLSYTTKRFVKERKRD